MKNTLKDSLIKFFKANEKIAEKFFDGCVYTKSLTDFLMIQCSLEEVDVMFEDVSMKELNLCECDDTEEKNVLYCFTKGKEKVYIQFKGEYILDPSFYSDYLECEVVDVEVRYVTVKY